MGAMVSYMSQRPLVAMLLRCAVILQQSGAAKYKAAAAYLIQSKWNQGLVRKEWATHTGKGVVALTVQAPKPVRSGENGF